jgi:hypothetical protein
VLKCRAQTSKAREGSRPPWVQIPPLPPTSRNELDDHAGTLAPQPPSELAHRSGDSDFLRLTRFMAQVVCRSSAIDATSPSPLTTSAISCDTVLRRISGNPQ